MSMVEFYKLSLEDEQAGRCAEFVYGHKRHNIRRNCPAVLAIEGKISIIFNQNAKMKLTLIFDRGFPTQ
jgi:hypothetical protein